MSNLPVAPQTPSYGFLIDNRKCIGCHACTTACKSENEVPLGVNRTWVKYVEKGVFPHTRRYFQVTRCNHCANPPCVAICPTAAMFQRADGIVDFNGNVCIGCKACMQACPYDAIYIDPNSHTAAKCHYCAHRTEVGLEPACVIVCPVHAIVAGDLNDANSEIARAISTQQVRVRKPEQATKPKLFYIDAEEAAIVPTLAQSDGLLWATLPSVEKSDWRGPIQASDVKMAGALMQSATGARETYNVPHRVPWHWQVPAYLVTKAIGAGIFILITLSLLFRFEPPQPTLSTTLPLLLSLIFTGITTGLLIWDLDQPTRFYYMLIRPQWRSWLTRGAFILIAFSLVAGLLLLTHLMAFEETVQLCAALGIPLAILVAVYTAFLFAQAEGRDLWQSPLLSFHLCVQALMAGAACLFIVDLFVPSPYVLVSAPVATTLQSVALDPPNRALLWFIGSAVINLLLTLGGEFAVPHASQVAATAAHMITKGRYKTWYWTSVLGGLVVPLIIAVLFKDSSLALALAGLLSLIGLFMYEWAFVMAPQQVPNN
jgi:Fe-S-cluster-containing dehydrogenase component/formate-dependent nitrite reductase membrane component NrfD